jgi:hypothetical protein
MGKFPHEFGECTEEEKLFLWIAHNERIARENKQIEEAKNGIKR